MTDHEDTQAYLEQLRDEDNARNLEAFRATIPAVHRDRSMADVSDEVAAALTARGYPDTPQGLWINGEHVGCGKSGTAAAIALGLARRGHRPRWVYVPPILKDTRPDLGPIRRAKIVVLDDLGLRDYTPWAIDTLDIIAELVWAERKVALITSNYTLADVAAAIGGVVGERIGDRFAGATTDLWIPGTSRRGGR